MMNRRQASSLCINAQCSFGLKAITLVHILTPSTLLQLLLPFPCLPLFLRLLFLERLPSALASFVFNGLSSCSGHKVDSSGNKILDRALDKLQGPGPPAHVVVHHLALLISLPVSPLDAEEDVPQGGAEVLHLEQILLKLLHLCRCEPKPNPGG